MLSVVFACLYCTVLYFSPSSTVYYLTVIPRMTHGPWSFSSSTDSRSSSWTFKTLLLCPATDPRIPAVLLFTNGSSQELWHRQ